MIDFKTELECKLDELSGKEIYLYGAHNLGDFAYKLLRHYNIRPNGYVLTIPSSKRELNGLPIYGINELPEIADKNAAILLTLNEKYHEEVKSALQEKGFYNVDTAFSGCDFYYYFFSDICKNIFVDNEISLTGDVLEFGKYRLMNPFVHENLKSFFLEAADLVLPPLFGNYDFLTEGPYEYGDVQLNEGDTVIDCGANIGLFSCYAASKGCYSYAFEPIGGHLAEILAKHSELNHSRIKPCPYALADKQGQMTINVSPHDESASLVMWGDSYTYETVEVTTIDQYVKDNQLQQVDFIKADIEGAERLMLAGAQETLKRFAPKLAICTYHLEDDPQVLEDLIRQANPEYKIVHKWKKLFASV